MNAGKVPPELLRRLVYPHLGRRPDILLRAGIGEDCAALDFGDWATVVTCDPITAAAHHLGRLAVHVACNDLATSGAEPLALLLILLLREGIAPDELEAIMSEAGQAAKSLGLEIIGGHTEVTPGLDRTIAAVTAIGRARKDRLISGSGARPHDAVILTKGAGIEGTAVLAADLPAPLAALGETALARARGFLDHLSVVPEGSVAARNGATAMHDVTEGGVLAGAWELAEASGLGISLRADDVPVRPETSAICHLLELDPLALIGSGAMLICTADPRRMLRALADAGIPAAEVGLMAEHDRIVLRKGQAISLVPPPRDELYRALERVAQES